MSAHLWIALFLGLTALIVFLLMALQRWTATKQQQMSAEEFRLWFQKNYLGVSSKADSTGPLNHGESTTRGRKAGAAIHQDKLPS